MGEGWIVETRGDVGEAGVDGGIGPVEEVSAVDGEGVGHAALVEVAGVRCTRPRISSPSTTAVTVGRRTVRRSASAEGNDPFTQEPQDPVLG